MNHKDTKRKRTSRIKRKLFFTDSLLILETIFLHPYPISFHFQLQKALALSQYKLKRTLTVKGLNLLNVQSMISVKAFGSQVNLNWYCFVCRKVSGSIDTAGIPEVTCQTEDDSEKGVVVSQGTNQIVDIIVNKKFVLDAANPVKDSVHSKRFLCSVRELHFLISISIPKQWYDKNILFVL